jgi:hypothetical protein
LSKAKSIPESEILKMPMSDYYLMLDALIKHNEDEIEASKKK